MIWKDSDTTFVTELQFKTEVLGVVLSQDRSVSTERCRAAFPPFSARLWNGPTR